MENQEKKMRVIGLICEDIFTDFAKEVIRGVQNATRERDDVRLIVLVGRQNEIGEVDKHYRYKSVYNYVYRLEESSKFDGLILTLPNFTALEMDSFGLEKIRNYERIPKVLIATNSKDETSVNYDNESGLREAIDYLTDVRGLHRICMLGGRDDNPDAMERKRLFGKLLAEKGITFRESDYQKTDMSVECVPEAEALLDRNPDAQAIFCVNDPAAVALYAAMDKRGLVPGKDILVFGFDNTHRATACLAPRRLKCSWKNWKGRRCPPLFCRPGCLDANPVPMSGTFLNPAHSLRRTMLLLTSFLMTAFTDSAMKAARAMLQGFAPCSMRSSIECSRP